MTYLHGVEVLEFDTRRRPIIVVQSSIIGIAGTAPNSAAEAKASLGIGSAAANNGLAITTTGAQIVAPADDKAISATVSQAATCCPAWGFSSCQSM